MSICLHVRRMICTSLGEIGSSYSNWIILRMDLGMKGGLSLCFRAGSLDLYSFLIWQVVLTIKEKARLRRRTIAAIWARVLAVLALRILGLSRILRSSFMVLLERSEAGRSFLKVS